MKLWREPWIDSRMAWAEQISWRIRLKKLHNETLEASNEFSGTPLMQQKSPSCAGTRSVSRWGLGGSKGPVRMQLNKTLR